MIIQLFCSEESIADFVEVQCFLPTGMVLDVSVHPDDSIFQIKQILLNSATADLQFPLRGRAFGETSGKFRDQFYLLSLA